MTASEIQRIRSLQEKGLWFRESKSMLHSRGTATKDFGNRSVATAALHLLQRIDFGVDGVTMAEDRSSAIPRNGQYRELIKLVNLQKEQLNVQLCDLTKLDAEIAYWECKCREQRLLLEHIRRERAELERQSRRNERLLATLAGVEEESERVKRQGESIESEIALLRSEVSNRESELLRWKEKVKLLLDDLRTEETTSAEDLVSMMECVISERRQQLEQLTNEMKEANLRGLLCPAAERVRDGNVRKMVGYPRQLQDAVATNKNPHGVWV
ncbi:UNVERIFIED_CONTAM: hypothetical protein PYX00_005812 [Menopon gallinae]|uniref:Uncharacterized protein n=1 Tax=Menopon gallinae TaxID=328185 RepID=A0AAW2HUA4_9NEOP